MNRELSDMKEQLMRKPQGRNSRQREQQMQRPWSRRYLSEVQGTTKKPVWLAWNKHLAGMVGRAKVVFGLAEEFGFYPVFREAIGGILIKRAMWYY